MWTIIMTIDVIMIMSMDATMGIDIIALA